MKTTRKNSPNLSRTISDQSVIDTKKNDHSVSEEISEISSYDFVANMKRNATQHRDIFGPQKKKKVEKTILPGPAAYFPKYNTFGTTHPKAMLKYIKTPIYGYYYKTSVPIMERAYIKKANGEPGPGRFDPPSAIGPTHPPGLIYWPDAFITAELETIKKYRRLPYQHYNLENYVEDAKLRNIKGNGFTSLFKPPVSEPRTIGKNRFERLPTDYIAKILSPRRKVISFRSEPIKQKETEIILQVNVKHKLRKAYENNKCAFGSGSARWPDEVFTKRIEVQKRQDEGIPKNPAYNDTTSRFQITPKKYKPRIRRVARYYRFDKELPVKQVFDESHFTKFAKNKNKTTYFEGLKMHNLVKPEYVNRPNPKFVRMSVLELPGFYDATNRK